MPPGNKYLICGFGKQGANNKNVRIPRKLCRGRQSSGTNDGLSVGATAW